MSNHLFVVIPPIERFKTQITLTLPANILNYNMIAILHHFIRIRLFDQSETQLFCLEYG